MRFFTAGVNEQPPAVNNSLWVRKQKHFGRANRLKNHYACLAFGVAALFTAAFAWATSRATSKATTLRAAS